MVWNWSEFGMISGAVVGFGGLYNSYRTRRQTRDSTDSTTTNTRDRQARADERQAIADERTAWADQRTAWNEELEQLLGGYKSVFDEMRLEFDRMRQAHLDCEAKHAAALAKNEKLESDVFELRQQLVTLRTPPLPKPPPEETDAGTA